MQERAKEINREREAKGETPWNLRIGIHSGPVIAGVVGRKKFAYDIWGDTVNTAARMESSGIAGEINISANTFELIKDFYQCEHRGKVEAKSKGEMDMYLLKGLKPEFSGIAHPSKLLALKEL
jgi:adenylate cyclase